MVLTNSEALSGYNGSTEQEVKAETEVNLYIDVLFCINFTMDFLALSIVRRGLRHRFRPWRMALSAGLGSAWAVFAAAFPLPVWLEMPITYGAVSSLMVFISFDLRRPKEILQSVAALYLAAVVMAGAMEALYQHTAAGYYIEQFLRGNLRKAMPLFTFFLLAAGAWFGIQAGLWEVISMAGARSHFYEVTLYYKGREKKVRALLDTGNRLYEPVSRRPVHVVTYEAVKELCESVAGVVYIPFGSVGTRGMLPGIFLDQMEVRQGNQVKVIKKPLIAVSKRALSKDGDYQMLLHEE